MSARRVGDIEYDLLPWCAQNNVAVMAYSPLGHSGGPLRSRALADVAKAQKRTADQMRVDRVMASKPLRARCIRGAGGAGP